MKKYSFFLTPFLLVLIVTGCRIVDNSPFEPASTRPNSNDLLISQADIPPTKVVSTRGEANGNDLTLTPPPTQNSTDLGSLEWASPDASPTSVTVNQSKCNIRYDWPVYTVKRGDTLAEIARLTNVSVGALVEANCLEDPDRIYAGQILNVPRQVTPSRTPIPTPSPAPQWIHYFDPIYHAEIDYPATWQQVADGINIRFKGTDGFVQLLAIGANGDLDEVTYNEANHQLMPYGANPVIQHYNLMDGREAHLILPSAGQQGSMNIQAALITHYIHPIEILGTECNYFMMVVDVAHINQIAGTLILPVLTMN